MNGEVENEDGLRAAGSVDSSGGGVVGIRCGFTISDYCWTAKVC